MTYDVDALGPTLSEYQETLRTLKSEYDFEEMKEDPDLAKQFIQDVREPRPLSVTVPEEYGGDGVSTKKFLKLADITGYESLPFALLFGINGALFLQPIIKHAEESTKKEILPTFLEEKRLGGLMITEPDHGTDALNMTTGFTQSNGNYHVSGIKHWGGLTGWADHWIVAARNNQGNGSLGRDISLFLCDKAEIEVTQLYSNLGLSVLPYGRNEINADPSLSRRLEAESSGLRMMQDFFHRSRLQFPGMATGYLRRVRDEAHEHCRNRVVGGSELTEYEHVRRKLRDLEAAYTIGAAMCLYTAENVRIHEDVSGEIIHANSIKAYVTDLMQQAADSYLQLAGANGYRSDHLAGQSYVDTRPFQIFEGPNDVLYDQVAKKVLDIAKKNSLENFLDFVDNSSKINDLPDEVQSFVDFRLDGDFVQSQRVNLGRLIARLLALDMVDTFADRGYSSERIALTKSFLNSEVRSLSREVQAQDSVDEPPLSNDADDGGWISLVE